MKILVVDNQAEAAEALAADLRELTGAERGGGGGQRRGASGGARQWRAGRAHHESVLGDEDGFTLREAIRELHPELRTIFVTEYDLSEYQEYLDGAPVFYKPVDPKALLPALAAAPVSVGAAAQSLMTRAARTRGEHNGDE